MKILVSSYSNFAQNSAGGVCSKVLNFINSAKQEGVDVKAFDIWSDKIKDCDIIHYFALKAESYSQILLAKSLGKKIVVSSVVTIGDKRKIKTKIKIGRMFHLQTNETLCQAILTMSDAVITETSKEKEFIISAYGTDPRKIHVIPNGVSSEIMNGDPEIIKRKIGVDVPFVLQVGRFDSNKNQLSIIRALAGTDIPVVFIGGPEPSEPDYYTQCLNEASPNCHFIGWVNHSDPLMASAYAAAKVVVLPSFHEIFGNAIFEGAITNSNIVATNVLPLDEFGFSGHAFPIEPNNISDIRESIMKAYVKEVDYNFAASVKDRYSFPSIIRQHLKIYQNL